MKHESDADTKCNCSTWNDPQKDLKSWISEDGQNTEKSHGDFSEIPSANAGVENSQGIIMIIIILIIRTNDLCTTQHLS